MCTEYQEPTCCYRTIHIPDTPMPVGQLHDYGRWIANELWNAFTKTKYVFDPWGDQEELWSIAKKDLDDCPLSCYFVGDGFQTKPDRGSEYVFLTELSVEATGIDEDGENLIGLWKLSIRFVDATHENSDILTPDKFTWEGTIRDSI